MGAIVGTLYAAGHSPAEIHRILKPLSTGNLVYGNANARSVRNKKQKTLITLRFDRGLNVILPKGIASPQLLDGIIGSSVIAAQISSDGDFDRLPIPLRIWTTNLSRGEAQMHREGDILQIAKASASAPGFMPPVKIDEDWHVDGGLRANIPLLDSVRNENTFIFAVDVTSERNKTKRLRSLVDVIQFAVAMGMKETEVANAELADIVITPLGDDIKNTEFFLFDQLVQAGYDAAKEAFKNSPELQLYKNSGRVVITPPDEFWINVIELDGLQRTREWYMNRILDMDLDRPMTSQRIERITRIAEATDFFESFHITGHGDTLTAVVLEKERRSLGLGLRFDNRNLAEILVAPRYDNIMGHGVSIGGIFQIGYLRKRIMSELSWTVPIKQSFNWYVDFNAYLSSQRLVSRQIDELTYTDRVVINYSESDITKNGINLISGFEFANAITIFGGLRSEIYKSLQSRDGDVAFNFTEGNDRFRMLITGVETDYRDDAYFPSSGGRHRFWLAGASNEWGSRDRFFTINGNLSFVVPINRLHTFMPSVFVAWADQELPPTMRYYIGGGRFEDFTSASNILYTIPFAGVDNRRLFADNFFMFEFAWRYQFTQRHPFYFTLFVNGGNVWNYEQYDEGGSISREFFKDIPVGVETELAMRTPVGPLRFSWSRLIAGEFRENFGMERKNIFRFSAGFDF
jgi:predicted acylesterase/phospholipase RssA